MYQGSNIELWSAHVDSPIVVMASPPSGYSPIILFFAQIQNKYVEVGYQWL